MKKFRKALSMLMAVLMIASFSVPAFASLSEDVIGTDYEEAAQKLSVLGIMVGDAETGDFRPEENIKRSEFAKIAVAALGLQSAANSSAGKTKFPDVHDGHWATGYINIATAQSLVIGDDNGHFRPDDSMTYEEAITVLIRMLGYGPVLPVEKWPTNYLAKAAEIDLLEGLEFQSNAPATRGDVAVMTANALDIPMLIQTGYGTDAKYVVSGTEGTTVETILTAKQKLTVLDAFVNSVDAEKNEINVSVKNDKGEYSGSKKYRVNSSVSLHGKEKSYVSLWIDKNDLVLNVVTPKHSAVHYDYISKINDYNEDRNFTAVTLENLKNIGLKNADLSYQVAENLEVTLNQEAYTGDFGKELFGTFAKFIVKDGELARLDMYTAERTGIIKAVEEDYIDYQVTDKDTSRIRGFKDARNLTVVIDGKLSSYSQLTPEMFFGIRTFSISGETTRKDYVIFASTKTAEGALGAISDKTITIGGQKLNRAATVYLSKDKGLTFKAVAQTSDFNSLFGQDVSAILNGYGQIVYVKALSHTANQFYGIVTNAWSTGEDMIRIALINEGSMEERAFGVSEKAASLFDKVYANFQSHKTDSVEDRLQNIYKFTLDTENKLKEAEAISMGSEISAKSFDEDDHRIIGVGTGNNFDVSDAVMFDLTDPDEIKMVDWNLVKGTDDDGIDGLKFHADAIQANIVVFTAETDVLGGAGRKLGFVKEVALVSEDDQSMTIDIGEKDWTALVDRQYTPVKEQIALYQSLSEDRAKVVASAAYNDLKSLVPHFKPYLDTVTAATGSEADTVTKVEGKWLTMQNGLSGSTQFKVANDAIVYEVVTKNGDTDFVKSDAASIDNGDSIYYLVERDMIKVIFFVR